MAAMLAAASYSRTGFNIYFAVRKLYVMVSSGSKFHLEPVTILTVEIIRHFLSPPHSYPPLPSPSYSERSKILYPTSMSGGFYSSLMQHHNCYMVPLLDTEAETQTT